MKKTIIIHPFVFAIFPIFFLYVHNIKQVISPQVIFIPMLFSICFTFLLWLLLGFLVKDKDKRGIIVSLFLLLFFSYGHLYEIVRGFTIWGFMIGRHRYLFSFLVGLIIWNSIFLMKIQKNLHNLTKILNFTAIALITISLINMMSYKFKAKEVDSSFTDYKNRETKMSETVNLVQLDSFPDIYYIILDSYAQSHVLKEFYNFDNSEFINYLSEKGFYVASESKSNYSNSYTSLASSLNMEYINYMSNLVGVESKDFLPLINMIVNNKVAYLLKSMGYKVIHFSNWWMREYIRDADIKFSATSMNEFLIVLFKTTMLVPLTNIMLIHKYREEILYNMENLARIPNIDEPTFAFAHLIIPHEPYVFGPNGEFEKNALIRRTVQEERQRYLNQLIFLNKMLRKLINEIFLKSKVEPIIILQADHGPALTEILSQHPSKKLLLEGMNIFNAYYLPKDGEKVLYNTITPVNSFRLIFNLYFDANYALLSDRSYYSDYDKPYKFMDVTESAKF